MKPTLKQYYETARRMHKKWEFGDNPATIRGDLRGNAGAYVQTKAPKPRASKSGPHESVRCQTSPRPQALHPSRYSGCLCRPPCWVWVSDEDVDRIDNGINLRTGRCVRGCCSGDTSNVKQ